MSNSLACPFIANFQDSKGNFRQLCVWTWQGEDWAAITIDNVNVVELTGDATNRAINLAAQMMGAMGGKPPIGW